MSEYFHVSSNPHVRHADTTQSIMRDVLIALTPASLFGIWNFGIQALILIIVSIATCVAAEALYQYFMHKKVLVSDLSAAVTGLLIALNVPHTLPVVMVILGDLFAVIVVKQLFGGLGQNFMNPALAARCFLLISFAGKMTSFTYDGVTGATPLAVLKSGGSVNVLHMFLGTTAGVIGETSTVALLIGAAYLLARKVISIRIPAAYLISFSVFVLLFGRFDLTYLAAQLCGGGLMLGAFFMATDYVTSPATPNGKIVFGILLGILTGLFRIFGGSAEGVSYAIIFCNLLVPIIEKYTVPTPFGCKKGGKKA
jgi:Na+-translocating ferredoxin:NAD+ oxidoreductase RnfD subunit